MVIGAGGKVKSDLIRKGLALMNCPNDNIKQHLKTEGAVHLYHQLKNNVTINQPTTFILSDDAEDLGKPRSKLIITL
jgi:hypothetical protein